MLERQNKGKTWHFATEGERRGFSGDNTCFRVESLRIRSRTWEGQGKMLLSAGMKPRRSAWRAVTIGTLEDCPCSLFSRVFYFGERSESTLKLSLTSGRVSAWKRVIRVLRFRTFGGWKFSDAFPPPLKIIGLIVIWVNNIPIKMNAWWWIDSRNACEK